MKTIYPKLRISILILAMVALGCFTTNKAFAQDLDPVTDTLQTVPAGSYVIAMDNTLQNDPTYNVFNIKAYGLLGTILDNQIELFWAIRAGKAKDDTDFVATATQVLPNSGAASLRLFRAGPFIVEPIDSIGFLAVVNTFNAANPGHAVNVYQLTTSARVDIRYILRQKPRAAILNDGTNAPIMLNYMALASMPTANYTELSTAAHLSDSCYTFASEPHNGAPVSSVIDSIHAFVTDYGGNFLAQCLAVTEYENATNGRFQSTLGIQEIAPGNNATITFPHPDLSFTQFQGSFDGDSINSSVPSWELESGSVFTNGTEKIQEFQPSADSSIICLSVSKNGSGLGHLVFYAGGHDYGVANDPNRVNGMRAYFDAMFTPSNVQACAFLIFDNDLAVTKTAYHSTVAINQRDTFKIDITNNGPSSAVADTVTLTDLLPAGLTFVSAVASKGTYNSTTGLWSVGNVNYLETDSLIIIATANTSGSITNTAYVHKEKYDYNQVNDTSRVTITVASCAVAHAGDDTALCTGFSAVLGGNPTGTSGTSPYTYNWSPATGLSATNVANPVATPTVTTSYFLTVTDNLGCSGKDTVVVKVNSNPTVSASATASNYCSGSTITLNSTPAGGTTPYTYNWSGPSSFASTSQNPTRPLATTVMSGVYSITVTDKNGCTATASTANVTVNPQPAVSASSSSTTYCSGSTIQLTSSPSGGTPTYSYAWSFSGGGFSPGNVQNPTRPASTTAMSGTYTVTVTDANTCTATASAPVITIYQSPSVTASTTTPTTCSGDSIHLTSTPSSGTTPYSYNWSGPSGFSSNVQNPGSLNVSTGSSGVYDVTVTDAHSCTATAATATITVYQSPSVTASSTSAAYCSGTTISLLSTPTSGTPAYTYAWSFSGGGFSPGNVQNPTRPNSTTAMTGVYSVTISDSHSCTASASTSTITVNPSPTVTIGSNSPVCSGGAINLTSSTSTGTSPFGYSWSGPASFSSGNQNPSITGVTSANQGTYDVTISDAHGCSATNSVSVTVNPTASVNVTSNSAVCTGGTISLNAALTGGTSPFSYTWSGPAGFAPGNVSNPSRNSALLTYQGSYSVTVSDANGCSGTGSTFVTVNQSPILVASSNSIVCFGDTLKLSSTPSGGTAGYSYSWSGPSAYTSGAQNPFRATATPAMNGNYNVTVTDANSCTASATTSVTINPALTVNAGNAHTICNAQPDTLGGTPTAAGGTTPYNYNWSGGASSVSNPIVTPSATTTYVLTVTDKNSCSATSSVTINVNPTPTASAGNNVTLPNCSPTGVQIGGNTTASGGGGAPFTYSWSPNTDLSSSTASNPIVQGLNNSTTYTVVVTDKNGCTASAQATVNVVTNSPSASISANSATAWCAGSGGSVLLTANVTGGTSPLTYAWSGSNLSANNTPSVTANPGTPNVYPYVVTVTDGFNCTSTATASVTVNANPGASAGVVGGYSICANSSVIIGGNPTATGGGGTYSYSWSSGAAPVANPTVSPLSNTSYVVTVTDNNSCTATAVTSVTVNSNPIANAGLGQSMAGCSLVGVNIGGNPSASGGGGTYSYSWTPVGGLSSSTASNPNVVGIGSTTTYTLLVTDNNGCTATSSTTVTITSSSLSVVILNNAPLTWCAGTSGQVTLTAIPSNGTSPYSEQWTGTNLSTTSGTVTIANPNTAGTYTYSVNVTDATGCNASNSASVTVYPAVTASAGAATDTICNGQSATLGGSPTANGGTSPYSYSWTNGASSVANPSVSPTTQTNYNLVVTDANNCTATATTEVYVRPNPVASAGPNVSVTSCSPTGVQIGGAPTGSLGNGGPYTYSWSPTTNITSTTAPNPNVVGISGNTSYTVTVTDGKGCTASNSTEVTLVTNTPSVSISGSPLRWCAGTVASVNLTANTVGGTSPVNYNWSGTNLNPASAQVVSAGPAIAGSYIYDVTVTDGFNCTASATQTILIDSVPTASAGAGGFITCQGTSVQIGGNPTASGGTSPYSYQWSGGALSIANPSVNPGGTTTYTVTVTDANSCTSTASSTVIAHPTPTANAGSSVTQPKCSPTGVQIGGTPTANGGTGPYTYAWTPPTGLSSASVSNPTVAGLTSNTNYTVVVTDFYQCTASAQVAVSVSNTPPSVNISSGSTPEWCAASGTSSNLTANISGGSTPFSFNWSGTDINPTNAQTVNVNPEVAGSYSYAVTITDNYNCTATATKTVIVDSLPRANAGANNTICNLVQVSLGGSPTASGGTNPYTYSWSGGASAVSNPSVSPSATTTYFVTVTDTHNCTATSSATITVRPLPVANAGADKNLPGCSPTGVQIGGSPTANGGGGAPYTYAWSPSTGLVPDSFVANPTVVGIASTTTYTVTVSDANGCTSSDQVIITFVNNTPIVNISSSGGSQWCAGSGTGVNLTANVTGGTAAFGYNWSGGTNPTNTSVVSVSPNLSGSYPYNVTLTDGYNCTASATITIKVDTLPVASAGPANGFILCYGLGINIGGSPTVTGGTAPYTYTWSNGAASVANPTVSPLTTTTYLLTVTDSKGCSATAATTVFVSPPVTANAGSQQSAISCSGSCVLLGSSPTASGGAGGFTYKWSPGANLNDSIIANPTACGLPTNTFFNVTVTDQNGCTATSEVLIRVTPGTLAANVEPGGSICSGTNDSVMLGGYPTAVGGTPPYTYTWAPTTNLNLHDPANPIAFPTVTTTYDLTLTDALGCSVTDSALVKVLPKVLVNAGDDTTVCAGFPVNLGGSPTASGGNGSFTYQWSPTTGLTSVTESNPQALLTNTTTYIVTATDGNGCSASGNIIININPTPVANAGLNKTMTTCPLDSVILGGSPAATGGTSPYSYHWIPATGLDSVNVPHPVVKGIDSTENYVLFVTDSKGCEATSFVTVTVTQSTLQAQAGNGGSLCSNSSSTITLGGNPTATGGTTPYVYKWSPTAGLSSSTVPNPTAHPASSTNYYVTVTDALGCTAVDSASITINISPVARAGRDTAICSGGEVSIGGSPTGSSGTPGYTYSWSPTGGFISPTNSSNPLIVPSASTTYQVTVTDSKGCSATDAVLVTVRPNPTASAGSDVNLTTCPDDSAQIGGFPPATGGTGPYSYLWTPNLGLYTDTSANPWVKGITSSQSYHLQVTDTFGCKAADFVEVIIVQSTLQANAGNSQSVCSSSGTLAQLGGSPSAVGGSSPYTYHWFPTNGLSSSTLSNPTAQPASTTTYYLTVTDSKGCTSIDSVKITVKPSPTANAGRDTAICNEFSVTLGGNPTGSGGTPGYSYSWSPTTGLNSNNGPNPVAEVSSTSTFVLTLTDSAGCKAESSVTITVNPNPVASAGSNVSLGTCVGDSTQLGGSPSASGGTPGYSYSWSPSSGLNCSNCANPWLSGITSPGFYSLTVTDVKGCTATSQTLVSITQSNLTANAGNGGSLCPGAITGITLGGSPTAQGGTASYAYSWAPSNGLSSTSVSNPVANPTSTTKYYVTVTDSKGCIAVDSVQIFVYPSMTVNAGADTTICNHTTVQLGGSPTAGGGVSPFTYSWSPTTGLSSSVASNPLATPGSTRTYTVVVTGNTGCSASASVTVKVNANPSANAGSNGALVACNADSLRLGGTPAATGGTTPYQYSWSPGGGLSCTSCSNPYVSHLGSNATYTLMVTDSNGCTAESQVSISVTGSGLTATAGNGASFCQGTVTPVTLGGSPTASGGNGTYTYAWTPATGLNNSTIANPVATPTVTTKYNLVVTDGNGCIGIDSVLIKVNPKPTASAGRNDTICAGSQVVLGGSPTGFGGTGSTYTYLWSPGTNFITSNTIANPRVQPTSNIIYSVIVTDSLGCTGTASVNIAVNANPVANAGNSQTIVACNLSCANLGGNPSATGGTGPYLYAWSPSTGLNNTGLANPSACNLSHTTAYQLTVTDKNGCTSTGQVTVTVNPSTLLANAGISKGICEGQSTGVVLGGSPTASGGQGPYTYNWNPSSGISTSATIANPTANPTDSTTYIVFVQDALGCTAEDSITIYVDPTINASANSDTSVCSGSPVIIGGNPTANGGTTPYSYSWNPGTGLNSVIASNPTATPLTTTTYCVTVTDRSGCSASICQTINVNSAITACAGPSGLTMTDCSGSYVQLGCSPTASGGSGNYSYAWSPSNVAGVRVLNGSTISNPIVSGLSVSTVFTVTVTDNTTGCSATAEVNVNVTPSTLTINAGTNQVFCSGSNGCVTIGGSPTATGGVQPYQYQWSNSGDINNPTIANPCVQPVSTTTYTLTVTDQLGCSATSSVTITVNPQIVVNAGNDTSICSGQSVILGSANPEVIGGTLPYTYSWSPTQNLNNTTSTNPTAQNLTSNVTYTLLVTDSYHCTATGSIAINVRPLPTANAGPDATIYACAGDSALLGGSPTATGTVAPYTYQWNPPLNVSLSCLNCANPYVSNLGHNTQFCVTVTDSFGCQAQSCTNVTVLPNTVFANATPPSLSALCSNTGGCVTLGGIPPVSGGVGPYTYNWVQINSSLPHPQVCPTVSTKYTLIGTDIYGCQAADSVIVTVNQAPVVSVSGLAPQYCINASNVIMTGTPSGGTFSGSGVSGNVFQPSIAGVGNWCITYSYTNATTGCSADTVICVTVNALPVVSIGSINNSYCQSDPAIQLVGTPTGGVFTGPGIVGNTFNPASANIGNNTITYTYTNAQSGCSNSAQVIISVKANPTLSVSASADTACSGQRVIFTPTYSFDVFNIVWTTIGGANLGSGVNPIAVNPTGTNYCVVASAVNTPNGCITRDTTCIDLYQPPVITAPVVANTCENIPVSVDILSSVVDPQNHADVVSILVAPLHGTMVSTGNGNYTYTPAPFFNGQDSFKFMVCNSICANTCDTGTGYINVCTVASPPVINDTTITINENDSAHVCPVIYDNNGLPLVIGSAGCDSVYGQLIFTSDSCFEYIPPVNFTGNQTLCITVCNTAGLCDTGTIVIHVLPVGVPPVAVNDIDTTNYLTQVIVPVLVNDYNTAGDTFHLTGILCQPGVGTANANPNGTITYQPGPNATACHPDTFCYQICDVAYPTLCDTARVIVYIRPSVFAVNDSNTTSQHNPVIIPVLNNDHSPDCDPFSISQVITSGTVGSVVINANGTVTYTPNSDTCGFTDKFRYVDTSAYGALDTATVYVNVICCPTKLTAVPDTITIQPNTTLTFNPAANDIDSGALLTYTILSGPVNGQAHYANDSTLVYVPELDYCGNDRIVYLGTGPCGTDTGVITIKIICRTKPYAANDTVSACSAMPVSINVFQKDTAEAGFTLSVTSEGTPVPANLGAITSVSNGVITFTPAGVAGTVTFLYTVCDNGTQPYCSSGTIVINISVCQAPVVGTIYDTTLINTTGTACIGKYVNAWGNAWQIDSMCNAQFGVDTLNAPGDTCLTYVPQHNYLGNDTFCVVVCDTFGCTTSYVIYTVINPDIKAVSIDCDKDTIPMNSPDTLYVLANDTIPAASDTTVLITSTPLNGSAFVNSNYSVTYVPNNNYKGTDEFVYEVCAITGSFKFCDTASVCITVVDTSHHCIIPDGFSPNGDGVNDLYEILCDDMYPQATLKVFNRWGDQVWDSNGPYQNNWDGKNQDGTVCPTGTYFIIYDYHDGIHKSIVKFVVLNR